MPANSKAWRKRSSCRRGVRPHRLSSAPGSRLGPPPRVRRKTRPDVAENRVAGAQTSSRSTSIQPVGRRPAAAAPLWRGRRFRRQWQANRIRWWVECSRGGGRHRQPGRPRDPRGANRGMFQVSRKNGWMASSERRAVQRPWATSDRGDGPAAQAIVLAPWLKRIGDESSVDRDIAFEPGKRTLRVFSGFASEDSIQPSGREGPVRIELLPRMGRSSLGVPCFQ